MKAILEDRRLLLPTIVTALVIAIGSTLIVVLTGDATAGGSASASSSSSEPAGPAEGGSGETVKVNIAKFLYDPETVTIKTGTTVEWTNQDTAPHNSIGDDVKTDDLNQGESDSVQFDTAGTYEYICTFHPFMKGKVVVE